MCSENIDINNRSKCSFPLPFSQVNWSGQKMVKRKCEDSVLAGQFVILQGNVLDGTDTHKLKRNLSGLTNFWANGTNCTYTICKVK